MYEGRLNPTPRVPDGLSKIESLGFFDEFGFQVHRATIDFTTDIMVALLQTDAFSFSISLDNHRATFDFRTLN